MEKERHRKQIRLHRATYEIPHLPFSITICCQSNRRLFRCRRLAQEVYQSVFSGSLCTEAELSTLCLMPDHLHLLIAPLGRNLIDLIAAWKRYTTSMLRRTGVEGKVWQRSFYDHALRKDEDIRVVTEYIVSNPVRAGLVDNWTDYPYAWHRWGDSDPP